jgi:hypothetical protein
MELGELQRKISFVKPAVSFDSRIVSGFLEIFAKLRGKGFEIMRQGSRGHFKANNFTADVTSTQTLWP